MLAYKPPYLTLVATTLLASSAQAAQFTVTNQTDGPAGSPPPGSLRGAIEAANNSGGSDEIFFSIPGPGPHIITLTAGQLDITDDLILFGTGKSELRLDGNNASRVIATTPGVSLGILELTIQNASPPSGDGGGIAFAGGPGTRLALSSVKISNNTAPGNGGGIAITDASLDVVESSFDNNSATNGGAVSLVRSAAAADPTDPGSNDFNSFFSSTLRSNSASGAGGGVFVTNTNSSIHFFNCALIENTAAGTNPPPLNGGGALFLSNTNIDGPQLMGVTISSSVVESNHATGPAGFGGGVHLHSDDPEDSVFLNTNNSTFKNNNADQDGGGIKASFPQPAPFTEPSGLDLFTSTFTSNSAGGPASTNTLAGTVSIDNGRVVSSECSIVENHAAGTNTASLPPTGGIAVLSGELRIENSVIADNNLANPGPADELLWRDNGNSTFISNGANLVFGSVDLDTATLDPGDLTSPTPHGLSPLAPSPLLVGSVDARVPVEVRTPLPGSALIDAAPLLGGVDQIGTPRGPGSLSDIGAVEFASGGEPGASEDFGDAPDSYATDIADTGEGTGPSHTLSPDLLQLGPLADAEPDGQPSPFADGDDALSQSDEDSLDPAQLQFAEGTSPVIDVAVINDTGNPATLGLWIDLDGDGTFNHGDPAEEVITTVDPIGAHTVQVQLPLIPPGTFENLIENEGLTFLRLRLSSDQTIASEPRNLSGTAPDGEVEDWPAYITPPPAATVTLALDTLPDSPDTFLIEDGNGGQWFLTDNGTGNFNSTTLALPPGAYKFIAAPHPGWDVTALTVTGDTGPTTSSTDIHHHQANIKLDPGENLTVTFTHSADGSIQVSKTVLPSPGKTFGFTASLIGPSLASTSGVDEDDIVIDPFGNTYILLTGRLPGDDTVLKTDRAGNLITSFAPRGTGTGQVNNPTSIARAADGTLYITQQDNSEARKYDAHGNFLGSEMVSTQPSVLDLDISASGDFVTVTSYDSQGQQNLQYQPATGSSFTKLPPSSDHSYFSVAITPDGSAIYAVLAGSSSATVEKYDPTGQLLTSWSIPNFAFLSISPSGEIYVGNEVFGPSGTKFADLPISPNDRIAIDELGNLYLPGPHLTFVAAPIPLPSLDDGQSHLWQNLPPATYRLEENASPGSTLQNITVTDPDGGSPAPDITGRFATLEVDSNELVQATFTNLRHGTVVITKEVTSDPNGTDFQFVSNIPGNTSFALDHAVPDDADATPTTLTLTQVPTGAYSVQELASLAGELVEILVTETATSDAVIDLPNRTAAFNLEDAETVTLTFRNRPLFDFGDLPDSYHTTLALNGARHTRTPAFLGESIDTEPDGQPTTSANEDDNSGPVDDEDGVEFITPLAPGKPAEIRFSPNQPGWINAWVDWNMDGDFHDTVDGISEQIFINHPLQGPGFDDTLPVLQVPASAAPVLRCRFRYTSDDPELTLNAPLPPEGHWPNGEVEDYVLGTIGGRVWLDEGSPSATPNNGLREIGEPLAPDTLVSLLDIAGNPVLDSIGAAITDTTDANGLYHFSGLPPATYLVHFTSPAHHTLSPQDIGLDDTIDSDADPATGIAVVNLAPGQATGTTDAGLLPPPVLTVADISFDEFSGRLSFNLYLSYTNNAPFSLTFETIHGTTDPGDFGALTAQTLNVGARNIALALKVDVTNDLLDEDDETFTLQLTAPTGIRFPGGATTLTATATIVDDDPTPTLSLPDTVVAENAGPANFTATLSEISGRDVTVTYATNDGTALQPGDYTATTGTLTIPRGQSSATVPVPVISDNIFEPQETFTLTLSNPTNVTVPDPLATANIVPASTLSETAKHAWGENIGYTIWRDDASFGGLAVAGRILTGYAWAENVGYLHFGNGAPTNRLGYAPDSATDYGVNLAPDGTLTGHAWGENIGWVRFEQTHGKPAISPTGHFSGYAWGENVGWIGLAGLRTTSVQLVDTDGDNIDDHWEIANHGNLTTAGPTTDTDKDGVTDAQESIAGTDPNDPNDYLRITTATTDGPGADVTVTFPSNPRNKYRIETNTVPGPNGWQDSGLGLFTPDAGPTTTRTFTAPAGTRLFYRIVTVQPLAP